MDHFASSVGNLIYVESNPKFKATKLSAKIGSFVLANSGVKKETGHLNHRRKGGGR